jgi:two-component system sensor histidine kinase PilS (NtrC family)
MIALARSALTIDRNTQAKISIFYLARLILVSMVLLSTIFLKQEVLGELAITQILTALSATFFISLVNVAFWDQTLRVRYFLPSQLLYDLLLTSYLVYLTGVNDSIFLFLYLLNILFASVVYQLNGALLVAVFSGVTFGFIYYVNNDMDNLSSWYNLAWNELLFLLTSLLSGQFMDELKRQKFLLESQRENIERLEILNDKLLNSIPLGILLVDEEEYIQKVNQTALEILGLRRAPEMRLKFYELLPELKGIFMVWYELSDAQRLRFLFRPNDRSDAHISLQVVKISFSEGKNHHIMMIQDVSKMLELEQKLEYETRLAATGELAAGIAHEIRNPLASISGSIELLGAHLRLENTQDKKLLEIALRETKRLNHLITDFLEFAKPKNDSPKDFLLHDVVREVAEAVQNQKTDCVVSVINRIPPAQRANANRERMKQVFFNFFLNSMEAALAKKVEIVVESNVDAEGRLHIIVADDGPGVPPGMAEKVFSPFFTTKEEGTGLGLATVAQILRAAKGEVHLEPSAVGAKFRLIVPTANIINRSSGRSS